MQKFIISLYKVTFLDDLRFLFPTGLGLTAIGLKLLLYKKQYHWFTICSDKIQTYIKNSEMALNTLFLEDKYAWLPPPPPPTPEIVPTSSKIDSL